MIHMVTYYLHHAGGLPCVPRNLVQQQSGSRRTVVAPLRYADAGGSIEEFAGNAIAALAARAAVHAPGPRILYGHSMGGVVAYEICRQLGQEAKDYLDYVLLAAAAPSWRRQESLGPHPTSARPENMRLQHHLDALHKFKPHTLPQISIPAAVLYSPRDPVVRETEIRKWSSTGWNSITFHKIESTSHLFHTERATSSLPAFLSYFSRIIEEQGMKESNSHRDK